MFKSKPKYTLFFHAPSPFSQWTICKFKVGDQIYNCGEQFMMAEKARLFKDEDTRKKILTSQNPQNIKRLGRMVKNFDAVKWNEHKLLIVYKGNLAKFSQNAEFKKALVATGDTIIAEASPYDRVWGTGLSIADSAKCKSDDWPGTNLLGVALMTVRSKLI